MSRHERNTTSPDDEAAAPSDSNNAFVYLVIQKSKARGCLPALLTSNIPIIDLDGVDTTIVNTWNPQPSMKPPK